jgi:hypothetical protein
MHIKEAKKVKIGDRVVIWAESPDACTGSAIEVGFNAVKFEWDDGQIGIVHHNDFQNIARHYGDKIVPKVKA